MGFDFECVPNLDSIPKEYFCPVCRFLVNPKDALQSMCGHLYCKPCLINVARTTRMCPYDHRLVTEENAEPLGVSNRTLARTIDNIEVNCLYKNSGCKWLGSLHSASTSHCSKCPFSKSPVSCSWCGASTEHRQWREHARVCLEIHQRQMNAYIQANAAMATSQATAQGHGVASATLTQQQLYQQPYQPYFGVGYYMPQHPMHFPSLAPQHHVNVQPAVHYGAQMQAPPQLQLQNPVLHQPQTVFPSAPNLVAAALPQTYPSMPPHLQHPSQTSPASQGLPDVQAQTCVETTPLSQDMQNAQVPQQKIYPQPNQINEVQAPPNKMSMDDQAGTSQVQNHFPGKVLHVHPPQSLPMMNQQSSLSSQLTRAQNMKEVVLEYGGAQVAESSDIYSSKEPVPKPTLPEQQTVAPTTDVVRNQMHHGGLQNPIGPVQGLQKHPQTLKVYQPITPIRGVEPKMNHHSASASQVGSGQSAPSLLAVKEADVQKIEYQLPESPWEFEDPLNYEVWEQGIEAILDGSEAKSTFDSTNAGVNREVEVNSTKLDHDHKGKGIDASVESLHSSSIFEEGNGRKSWPLGKQGMEGNVGNGQKNLGKSLLVDKKGTGSGPYLDGTLLLDPVLLEKDGLTYLNILHQQHLMTAHLRSKDVERSGSYSSGSLDRGFDQRSPVSTHKKQELGFELSPASFFSQPSIDLGEGQFRNATRRFISEHLGMSSHGSGPLDHELWGTRAETTDTEGKYGVGLLKSEFEGHGNLQMGEKVQDADVIKSRYNFQGFHGDGGLFTGDLGSFPSSGKMAIGTIEPEGLYLHSQGQGAPTEVNGYGRRDPAACKETYL